VANPDTHVPDGHHPPCHGQPKSYIGSSLSSLLTHFGFAPPEYQRAGSAIDSSAKHHWHTLSSSLHEEIEKAKARHDRVEDGIHPMLDAWKMHVAEMVNMAEDKVVPILEGGVVRILPIMGDAGIASGSGPTEMQAKHREGLESSVPQLISGFALKQERWADKEHRRHAHSHHSHSHGHHGHRKAHAFGHRYVSIYT
jgi:hypothetical protein